MTIGIWFYSYKYKKIAEGSTCKLNSYRTGYQFSVFIKLLFHLCLVNSLVIDLAYMCDVLILVLF